LVQEDVVRLDISMDDAVLVEEVECGGDASDDINHTRLRENTRVSLRGSGRRELEDSSEVGAEAGHDEVACGEGGQCVSRVQLNNEGMRLLGSSESLVSS
jgi:hypothetical protein